MRYFIAILCVFAAAPLGAHPHVFIDVGLKVFTDEEGRVQEVEVTWKYDALFSLFITEDMGLDKDGDAQLTAEEEAALTGFDMKWIKGYNGDLVARLGAETLDLGGPHSPTARMEDGQIITSHRRKVAGMPPLAGATLVLKPYDRTFYTAYDVTLDLAVSGLADCDISKHEPDVDKELLSLQSQLAELGRDQDAIEMGFPEVGESFATEVRFTCAGS